MSKPDEIYDLLLDYASCPNTVETVNIGLVWTLCHSTGATGLTMSPGVATRTLPWVGTLVGQPLAKLAAWIRHWEPYQACVGLAAINCALRLQGDLPPGETLPVTHSGSNLAVFEHFLPLLQGKKVVVVGHYPGIERYAAALDMAVLERQPQAGDYPDPAAEFLLPQADWVFLTASSLANKTFPRLAQLAQAATTVLMGPSVPWLPEFHRFGIDYLAGVEVVDSGQLLQTVAEGGGVRIFDSALRYRVLALRTENNMQWLKQQIAVAFAEKQRLTQAMESWYAAGTQRGRSPDYAALDALSRRLSRLDSAYKQLWDAQQPRSGNPNEETSTCSG